MNLLRLLLLSFRPRRFLSTLNPSMGHIPACQGTAVHLPAARPSNAAYRRYARSASPRSRACGSRSDSRTWISCSQSGPDGTFVPRVGRHGSKATLRWRRGQSPSPAIHIFRPPNQISRSPPHRLITCPKFHDDNEREYAGNFDNLSTGRTLWTDGFHGNHPILADVDPPSIDPRGKACLIAERDLEGLNRLSQSVHR